MDTEGIRPCLRLFILRGFGLIRHQTSSLTVSPGKGKRERGARSKDASVKPPRPIYRSTAPYSVTLSVTNLTGLCYLICLPCCGRPLIRPPLSYQKDDMSLMSTTGRRAFSPSGHGVLRRSRPSSCLRGYSPTPEHTWAFMPAGLSSTSGRAPGSGSLAWSCRGLTPTTRVCDAPIYSSALGIRHVRCFLSVTPRRNIEGREQG